ncbi:hypothetical protein AB0D11_38225 [Streptomyces monashensis]|uniref:hypothetical protein n=1 Tax=Streptomyces monashensis TaxID=1678012 RepID=UPI0033C920F2
MDLAEPAEPGGARQATPHSGVASQSATADRAPFNLRTRTPRGREELRGRPRRIRRRRTARHGIPGGAHVRKDDAP